MLHQFKTFQADRMDLDDLIALAAFGHMLRDQYEKFGLEVPDFVTDNIKAITREVKTKTAATLESRKRELLSRKDALKTPAERKREIEAELKQIDEQLQSV